MDLIQICFGSQIQGDLIGAVQWRIYQGVAIMANEPRAAIYAVEAYLPELRGATVLYGSGRTIRR